MSDKKTEDYCRIQDILAFILHLEKIIGDHDKSTFEDNLVMTYAIERLLHNIGEASIYISEELKSQNKQIPWEKIRGMRNVLAHGYDVLDQDTLWDTAQIHVRELKLHIKKIVENYDG
jgi:uncharacterized protein with HEPN domain